MEIKHHIYLAPHNQRVDTTLLPSVVESAQIVAPEQVNWDNQSLQAWRRVARGYSTPAKGIKELGLSGGSEIFAEYLMEQLHGNKKTIVHFDVPSDHPLVEGFKRGMQMQNYTHWILGESISHSWDDKLTEYDKFRRVWAQLHSTREDFMAEQPAKILPDTIKGNPLLNKLDSIEVAWTMGPAHVNLPDKVRSKGYEVQVTSEPDPFPLSYSYQVETANPLENLGNDLLAKAMLDTLFIQFYQSPHQKAGLPFWKLTSDALRIVEAIPSNTIPNLLNRAAYPNGEKFKASLDGCFKEVAQGVGISLPWKKI